VSNELVSKRPGTRVADLVGMTGSFLCALHCAAIPVLIAAVPGIGLGLLADEGLEWGFVVFATVLAVSSLWMGYRRHRSFRGWFFLWPGLAAVWAAVLYPPLHDSVVPHAVAMATGGTLIAVAHVLNLRLSHGHVQDACCHHEAHCDQPGHSRPGS
jgi:hypothetical protein